MGKVRIDKVEKFWAAKDVEANKRSDNTPVGIYEVVQEIFRNMILIQ